MAVWIFEHSLENCSNALHPPTFSCAFCSFTIYMFWIYMCKDTVLWENGKVQLAPYIFCMMYILKENAYKVALGVREWYIFAICTCICHGLIHSFIYHLDIYENKANTRQCTENAIFWLKFQGEYKLLSRARTLDWDLFLQKVVGI